MLTFPRPPLIKNELLLAGIGSLRLDLNVLVDAAAYKQFNFDPTILFATFASRIVGNCLKFAKTI